MGRFEAADGGTIFLDEIGNLPLAGQMKLLRVIEGGKFERVGSNATRAAKVRIVSATNADLPSMIREGSFRQDLYYRINVVEIAVPRLAERRADILPIAESVLGPGTKLSEGARSALESYPLAGQCPRAAKRVGTRELLCREALVTAEDLGLPAPDTKDASRRRHLQGIDRSGPRVLRWHDLVRSAGAGFVSPSALSANGSTGYAPMRLRTLSASMAPTLNSLGRRGVVGAPLPSLHNQLLAIAMACLLGLPVASG